MSCDSTVWSSVEEFALLGICFIAMVLICCRAAYSSAANFCIRCSSELIKGLQSAA